MTIRVEIAENSSITVRSADEIVAIIERPIDARGLQGTARRGGYDSAKTTPTGVRAEATWSQGDASITVTDHWRAETDHRVLVSRSIRSNGVSQDGVQLALELSMPATPDRRYFAPGMVYSPDQWADGATHSYCDARLAFPVVASIAAPGAVSLMRTRTGHFDEAPQRRRGTSRFLQRTDLGSVGFAPRALFASWPYYEGDRSAMLDAAGTAASAFYPLDKPFATELEYAIDVFVANDVAAAVHAIFAQAVDSARPSGPSPQLDLERSIDLRLDTAEKTFTRTDSGFAGFVLNFDPERGYDSDPKAFGASFTDHAMSGSHGILEYGFTGRQLNLAYLLAKRRPEAWMTRGAEVVDSFVERMTELTGWVHTLWDLATSTPVFACGDPRGVVMHYLGESSIAGTYTRMMAEAGRDLLLNIQLHHAAGRDVSGWMGAAIDLGGFFVRAQESDGSWFRAYAPSGAPIVETEWFGYRTGSGKTATGTVIPYLIALAQVVVDTGYARGITTDALVESARRAARYVEATMVATDDYRGGTLDNPNVVDKEAAFIVMQAMLALFDWAERTDDPREASARLESARRAATFAITWHSIWNVPNIEDTRLAIQDVSSVGWGGINSIWGVGVTDIYSLFFLADLTRLGRLCDEPLFGRIAELSAASSVQFLSTGERLRGFQDAGMQPEGVSFCSQGEDDGLIRKGDSWGGLAWPYTAGTYGLETYLRQANRTSGRRADAQQRTANHSQRRK